MTTYSFPEIWSRHTRTGPCPVCGKRTRRSKKFEQTVNPFNKNPDGTVKTRDEVWASVRAEAKAWEPDFRHEACKENVT